MFGGVKIVKSRKKVGKGFWKSRSPPWRKSCNSGAEKHFTLIGETKKNLSYFYKHSKYFTLMLQLNLIGNLGFDAKKVQGNFGEFVSFNVAHTEKFTDKKGVQIERVIWVNVVVNWNCENLLPFLKKGTKIFVSGSMRTRVYQDKNGTYCAGIDLHANNITLCGSLAPNTTNPEEANAEKTKAPLQSVSPFAESTNQEEAF